MEKNIFQIGQGIVKTLIFELWPNLFVCLHRFTLLFPARGSSLLRKSVRDFFRTKGFLRIFDGFFWQTKGFLPKAYKILWSEMPLGFRRFPE